jgi:hypothetical protein
VPGLKGKDRLKRLQRASKRVWLHTWSIHSKDTACRPVRRHTAQWQEGLDTGHAGHGYSLASVLQSVVPVFQRENESWVLGGKPVDAKPEGEAKIHRARKGQR